MKENRKQNRKTTMRSPRSGAEVPTGNFPGNTGGKPGRSGRPKDEVRQACLLAFSERLPKLCALADYAEPAVRLKAIDLLGKYGGMTFTQTEVEMTPPAEIRLYELPRNGRESQLDRLLQDEPAVDSFPVLDNQKRDKFGTLQTDDSGTVLPPGTWRHRDGLFHSFPEE